MRTKHHVGTRGAIAAGCVLIAGVLGAALPKQEAGSPASQPAASQPTAAAAELDEFIRSFGSGIVGSKHDFSDSGRVPRDLCTPCHTPHLTAAQAALAIQTPRTPSGLYSTKGGELSAASLVCLSCHDGVLASDVYAGAHAADWVDLSGRRPGEPSVTNHPVGVALPTADPKYHSTAVVEGQGGLKLPGGRIQCTTCHDPHNSARNRAMLVISNERSRLCLTCHRL